MVITSETGGLASPFFMLLLVTCVFAALIMPGPRAVLLTATIGAGHALSAWLLPRGILRDGIEGASNVIDRVVYDDDPPWPTEPDGNGPSLELVNPALDNALYSSWRPSLSTNGTQLLLSVPADVSHDVWTPANQAPRLMQAIADTDFELEVKFESVPTQRYQLQGLLVEADPGNYMRFDFHSNGSQTRIFAARIANGSPSAIVNTTVSGSGDGLMC